MNPHLSQLQPYPFARLREAMQGIHPPEGVAPVPLHIGEPKHPAPAVITDALTAALPRLDAYPQTAGLPELRQACAGFLQRRYGITLDPNSEILPVKPCLPSYRRRWAATNRKSPWWCAPIRFIRFTKAPRS